MCHRVCFTDFSLLPKELSDLYCSFCCISLERQREGNRYLWSPGSFPKCSHRPALGQAEVRSPGLNSDLHVGNRVSSTLAIITCCLSGCTLAGSWNWKWSWDPNTGTLEWEASDPSCVLTIRPNTNPKSDHMISLWNCTILSQLSFMHLSPLISYSSLVLSFNKLQLHWLFSYL